MWRKDATLAGSIIIVVTLISLTVDGTVAGSCRSAKLCCQGRDSGCVIQKESPNAIIESLRDKPCYCDHACLKLADCCDDFKDTCGVVDCTVSEWSPWSPCDNGCGSGTQRRSRVIEISEKNGGKHCPRLDQVRTCRSFQTCHAGIRPQPHAKSSVTLLALFPGDGNSTDVRIKDRIVDKGGSCVAFTIVRVSQGCSKISDLLSEGSRICVEGPGNESLDRYVGIGRWKLSTDIAGSSNRRGRSTNSTCHGKWIGDSRLLMDCHDPRCDRPSPSQVPSYTSQLFRDRRNADIIVGNPDRSARRRRRGRRRKKSRRRRRDGAASAVVER